jgi:WD40 repeat protein
LKRQKISDSYVSPVEAISCSGGIASLHWSSPSRIYVGGQDHQIKIVNVDTKKIEEIIFTNHKVPTSIDSIQDSLILTGHEDSLIRLWDIRVSSAGSSEKKFKSQYEGHDSWVSQVRVNLNAENVFISGSYDGTVKLWDLRNEERPIATLKRKDKSD